MAKTDTVFSEVEARLLGFIFADGTSKVAECATEFGCIGKIEEEMETKTITKKCRGTVAKKRTSGTGSGTLKVTAHVPKGLYATLHDMTRPDLAKGVIAYGEESRHPEFILTALVKDEDGNVKYKAYPNAVVNTGVTRAIENGAEEIEEIELEISVSPDEYGEGLYELYASENTELAKTWMKNFSSAAAHSVAKSK